MASALPPPSIEEMLTEYGITPHKDFYKWPRSTQLDFIAERILASNRKTKSHQMMKEEGYLSRSQLERRRDGEVYAEDGNVELLAVARRGIYSRAYRESNRKPGLSHDD